MAIHGFERNLDKCVGHGFPIEHSGAHGDKITFGGVPLVDMFDELFFVAHAVQFPIKIG